MQYKSKIQTRLKSAATNKKDTISANKSSKEAKPAKNLGERPLRPNTAGPTSKAPKPSMLKGRPVRDLKPSMTKGGMVKAPKPHMTEKPGVAFGPGMGWKSGATLAPEIRWKPGAAEKNTTGEKGTPVSDGNIETKMPETLGTAQGNSQNANGVKKPAGKGKRAEEDTKGLTEKLPDFSGGMSSAFENTLKESLEMLTASAAETWENRPVAEPHAVAGTDVDRLSQAEQIENAEYIYNALEEQGWSTEAICGLFGNIHRESHFNPGAWQGDQKTHLGYGLVQWTPADKKFLKWMADDTMSSDSPMKPENVDTMAANNPKELMDRQLEYLHWSSLSTTHWKYKQWQPTTDHGSPEEMSYEDYMLSEKDAGHLAEIFHGSYERSSDSEDIINERVQNANDWYTYFTEGVIPEGLFDR